MIETSCYQLAQRFVGLAEVPGGVANPAVLAMLRLDGADVQDDETSWCSAFANYITWLLRLPRSKSLAARSWLSVGVPMDIGDAKAENDVVIFWRGQATGWQGHVGFFAGFNKATGQVLVLGGNQGDHVTVAPMPVDRLLGIRRLA